MCTNQDISNIPFIVRGNLFLVHGHKQDLPYITCIFHLFKYVVKFFLVSAIFHHISLLRLLPKSYFKINTFQPNSLCSSYFNFTILTISTENLYKNHIVMNISVHLPNISLCTIIKSRSLHRLTKMCNNKTSTI